MADDATSPAYTAIAMVTTALLSSFGTWFTLRSQSSTTVKTAQLSDGQALLKMLIEERTQRETDNRQLRTEMHELRKLYDAAEAEKHRIAEDFEKFRDEQQVIRHDLRAQLRLIMTQRNDLELRVAQLEAQP